MFYLYIHQEFCTDVIKSKLFWWWLKKSQLGPVHQQVVFFPHSHYHDWKWKTKPVWLFVLTAFLLLTVAKLKKKSRESTQKCILFDLQMVVLSKFLWNRTSLEVFHSSAWAGEVAFASLFSLADVAIWPWFSQVFSSKFLELHAVGILDTKPRIHDPALPRRSIYLNF